MLATKKYRDMDHSLRRLYEDLRSIAVAVVYPPGEDRDLLVEQLKRIGCRIHLHWPFLTVRRRAPTWCSSGVAVRAEQRRLVVQRG